jgi:hypothetical protein
MTFAKKKYLVLATAGVTLAVALVFWKISPLFSNDSKTDKNTSIRLSKSSQDSAGHNDKSAIDLPKKIQTVKQSPQFRTANPFDTSLRRKFIQSTDLFALFTELQNALDPDSLFFRAVILDTCKGWGKTYKGPSLEALEKRIVDGMKGEFLEQRRAIVAERKPFGQLSLCRDFPEAITATDVDKAFKLAADGGDIRGQLVGLHKAIVMSGAPLSATEAAKIIPAEFLSDTQSVIVPKGPTVAQIEILKNALASKDPTQILFAGPLLTTKYSDYALQFGINDGLAQRYEPLLWKSVACHYGAGCDANSADIQYSCATDGQCNVGSYDQWLQRYVVVEPKAWEQFQANRQTLITAIDTNNWALLREFRGPNPNTSGGYIVPNPPRYKFRF